MKFGQLILNRYTSVYHEYRFSSSFTYTDHIIMHTDQFIIAQFSRNEKAKTPIQSVKVSSLKS